MENFIDRLINEHKQLSERMTKLNAKIHEADIVEKVGATEYRLLIRQYAGMEVYEDALATRLIDLYRDPYDNYAPMD